MKDKVKDKGRYKSKHKGLRFIRVGVAVSVRV